MDKGDNPGNAETARDLAGSLREHATSGFLWLFGNSVISRLVSFGSQLALAWILSPEAFGTIGLAYSIMAFATIFKEGGVTRVLVAEQHRFGDLAASGFWLSVVFGVGTASFVALAAPLVGSLYDNPELPTLLWILAAALPFQAARSVPGAALGIDLRFDSQTKLNVVEIVSQHTLTVLFALLGFGVYSFVLPILIVAPVVTGLYFWSSGIRPGAFQAQRWPEIFGGSAKLLAAGVLAKAVDFGDYLIIGAAFSETEVGLYFLAYTLSVQGIMLVVNNLGGMLFPVLSRLRHEPERQSEAFLRVCRVGASVSVPFSLFLVFHADPLIHTLYSAQWEAAAPLLMILSVGMAFRLISATSFSALNARGDYHLVLWNNGLRAVFFGLLVLAATPLGLVWVAGAVALTHFAEAIISLSLFEGRLGKAAREFGGIVAVPLAGGLTAGGITTIMQALVPITRAGSALSIAAGAGVFLAVNVLALRYFSESVWTDIVGLIQGGWGKLGQAAPAPRDQAVL